MPSVPRAHIVAGGFPPGQYAGHDHDFARLRLLELMDEEEIAASTGNDFVDIERWLPVSDMLITYVSGPFMADDQARAVRAWLEAGGRWMALHGSSGGKAARVEGQRQRVMVATSHHDVLGGFFINHPPIKKFEVTVEAPASPLMKGVPEKFDAIDEPYMVEVRDPSAELLLTNALGPDWSPPGFGFAYERDTSLLPDGVRRALGFTRRVGQGGVTYFALGHCHRPWNNSQPFVDANVADGGRTPQTLRDTWENPAYLQLLRNGLWWGVRRT